MLAEAQAETCSVTIVQAVHIVLLQTCMCFDANFGTVQVEPMQCGQIHNGTEYFVPLGI